MWKRQRRKKLQSAPFPPDWRRILEARMPVYKHLPEEDRREMEQGIQIFVAEKNFEGCGGLVITEEIKVCIAAYACLLLLHRETDYYPALHSILVYPSTYFVHETRYVGGGLVEEGSHARLGESWPEGAVVLAWDAVRLGPTPNGNQGHNLVLHEFAHQLDFEDGRADGAPQLGRGDAWPLRKDRRATWARVFSADFENLRASIQKGQPGLLGEYAATNPAEFFAVATECFFERPHDLRAHHPQLYQELKQFFCQDPAQWPSAG
jgi:MtfA peptidase